MMLHNSLMSLPPEILYEIVGYVGVDEFRTRLDRLTLCKQWYAIAMMVFMKDLKLSAKGLRYLPPLQKKLPIPRHLDSLSVHLQGYADWSYQEEPVTPQAICKRFEVVRRWSRDIKKDIVEFAQWLATLESLETFRFEAIGEYDPASGMQSNLFGQPRDYLNEDSVALMLRNIPSHRLTDLNLDTCGSSLFSKKSWDQTSSEEHICPLIAKHVNSLKSLRVRMHCMCSDMFGLDHLEPSSSPKSFVFHLTMFDPLKRVTSAKSAVACSTDSCSRDVLIDMITGATKKAVEKVPKLSVTVLYHTSPFALVSLDCRTGVIRSLELGAQSDWLDIENIGCLGEKIDLESQPLKTSICSID